MKCDDSTVLNVTENSLNDANLHSLGDTIRLKHVWTVIASESFKKSTCTFELVRLPVTYSKNVSNSEYTGGANTSVYVQKLATDMHCS